MNEDEKKKQLINEKIVGRKLTPGRVVRFLLIALACGLLFGVAAAFAFFGMDRVRNALAESAAQTTEVRESDVLSPEEPSEPDVTETAAAYETKETGTATEEVTMASVDGETESREDEESDAETETAESTSPEDRDRETEEETYSSAETETESESAEQEPGDPVEETSESKEQGTADGQRQKDEGQEPQTAAVPGNGLREAVASGNAYVVTVNAITTGTTWFESQAESSRPYAGMILDVTDEEILILTTGGPAASESLRVTFSDDTTADAYIKQYSARDNLAVLAVPLPESPKEEAAGELSGIPLADSGETAIGDPVIAVGAPLGVVNSCEFGYVGYISREEPAPDRTQRILYADMRTDPTEGTFLLDGSGGLLGIAVNSSDTSGIGEGLARIVTMDSLQNILAALAAGEKQAFVGLEGFGVTKEMIDNSIPEGMYITNVSTDGPAYNVGVKRGDILVAVNEEAVTDVHSYVSTLEEIAPGETVSLKVRRGSSDGEYRDMEFSLTAAER